MNFTKGDRVRHPGKPDWGMGQVLEDCAGQDVRVYFVGGGERKLRLDYVTLERVEGADAANPVLDSLGKRQPRTAAAGARRGKKERKSRTIAQLAEDFTLLFPEGFRDAGFQREERDSKVKAHETLAELLGREKIDALVSAGDHAEVCRRALQIISATNLVFPREAISLRNGLKDEGNGRLFAESLRSLLYGEAEAGTRFAAFCDLLAGMGAAKWPLATYFPFVAFPEREMFLKPTVTRKVAEMLGAELNYSVEPNWLTYSKLIELSRHIFDSLSELGPRDMFDVQSFISRVAGYEEGEQSEGEADAPAAPKTTAPARAADTEIAAAPALDTEGAGTPPWETGMSDPQAGAAGASSEHVAPSEAESTEPDAGSDGAAPSANEAAENEKSDGAGAPPEGSASASTGPEISDGTDAHPETSEAAGASDAEARSVTSGAPGSAAEAGADEASGAGVGGREGAAAAD